MSMMRCPHGVSRFEQCDLCYPPQRLKCLDESAPFDAEAFQRTRRYLLERKRKKPYMPVVYGNGALRSYLVGSTTRLDFNDGNVIIITDGRADISRLVFDGDDVRIHNREINHFDMKGRPVYEPVAYDFGERSVSITVKCETTGFMRSIRKLTRALAWLAFWQRHPRLARIKRALERLVRLKK
jgi:hypothetical protein